MTPPGALGTRNYLAVSQPVRHTYFLPEVKRTDTYGGRHKNVIQPRRTWWWRKTPNRFWGRLRHWQLEYWPLDSRLLATGSESAVFCPGVCRLQVPAAGRAATDLSRFCRQGTVTLVALECAVGLFLLGAFAFCCCCCASAKGQPRIGASRHWRVSGDTEPAELLRPC